MFHGFLASLFTECLVVCKNQTSNIRADLEQLTATDLREERCSSCSTLFSVPALKLLKKRRTLYSILRLKCII